MPLSAKKKAKHELKRRQDAINERSLNGKGYFMDAQADISAKEYLRTGDESLLNDLPDYREIRKANSSGRA